MPAYKVRRYCNKCGEITTSTMYMLTERMDGRVYESGVDRIVCDRCGSTETDEYNNCPICGSIKGASMDYCTECYDTTRDHLGALKDKLNASDGDFQEIICNCLGL